MAFLSSSVRRHLRVVALLATGALTIGCAGRQEQQESPQFTCPAQLSKALAFSHLKEAYVSLNTMTLDSAERARALTTDGLGCAPPNGNARAATVARLLVIRAEAASTLGDAQSALLDLEAALAWAAQGKKDDPLLVPEIHLKSALLHLHQLEHDKAAQSAAHARTTAQQLGQSAAGLQCEALLLEGDLALRRPRGGYPPDGYFRRIFDVAKRYRYPESVWPHMESASSRLTELSASQRAQLMGPVTALRKQKAADEREAKLLKRRNSKRAPDMVRMSKGSIADADLTVASMRAGFRRCYGSTSTGSGGRAVLSISVDAGGHVENVSAQSESMPPQTLECLKAEASRATFNPPDSEHAVLHVPVTFVAQ